MSEIVIRQFVSSDLSEVESIFFESSTRKEFKDQQERLDFQYKYLGHYLKHHRELALVAQNSEVLGYCVAAPQSDTQELKLIQPHLALFQEHFRAFPAHLHINLSAQARGQGIGGQLVLTLEEKLKEQQIPGLHIVTAPTSRNRSFYQRLGFHFEFEQSFKGADLLFMGKRL